MTFQKIDAWTEYKTMVQGCEWSESVSVANHTIRHMRARYPFPMSEKALQTYSRRFFDGCFLDWSPKVQTCKLRPVSDADGVQRQWFITRVGPLPLGPEAYKCIGLIPAMPLDIDGGTTFLVSSVDNYLADFRDGRGFREVGYPPVHPHHANSFNVGYRPSLTAKPLPGSSGGIFEGWYPWAAYTTHQLMTTGAQASMNTPGFNADLVGCRPGAELGACFFFRLPEGTGFPVYKGTDLWSTSKINRVGKWREQSPKDRPMLITWEFGRQFVTSRARPASIVTPVWTLDFAAVGNGRTYEIGRYKHLEGIVFHCYSFPVSGRVYGSWYHTHAQAKSELWVLSGTMEELLPQKILSACYSRGICKPSGGGSRGTVSTAIGLASVGYSIETLQQHILSQLTTKGRMLRCRYRSVAQMVDGQLWGRQSQRSPETRSSCDRWAFKAVSTWDSKHAFLFSSLPLTSCVPHFCHRPRATRSPWSPSVRPGCPRPPRSTTVGGQWSRSTSPSRPRYTTQRLEPRGPTAAL